eukprot:gb/GEZN01002616.1/.p1 GENE.gb/GEZN01002616.1/~~gb/GEZN01002616.1/.p1  ORF type:complete len:769 (+),score=148.43 gb/GEZN01002616.1/:55-2361(+)
MSIQDSPFERLSSERLVHTVTSSSFEDHKEAIQHRELGSDAGFSPPRTDDLKEHYTWDACMVCKVGRAEEMIPAVKAGVKGAKAGEKISEAELYKQKTADIMTALKRANLNAMCYLSVQRDEVYILIGASEDRLRREADRLDIDLRLDAEKALKLARLLNMKLAQMTTEDEDEEDKDNKNETHEDGSAIKQTKIGKKEWDNLYAKYEWFDRKDRLEKGGEPLLEERGEMYMHYKFGPFHPNTVFTVVDRLKLTNSIIEADEQLGGAAIKTDTCGPYEPLLAYFSLHDTATKQELYNKWYRWTSVIYQPLDEIRGYYGEQIALYFAFLSFYTKQLWAPAAFGVLLFIWQLINDRVDVKGLSAYAIVMALWSTLVLEGWKRYEAELTLNKWGQTNFHMKETARPEFKGEWITSTITGKLEEHFPLTQKIYRFLFSQTIIFLLIGVVLAAVVAIFSFRFYLQQFTNQAATITAVLNAIQITVLNILYGKVATTLNDFENHRTATQYDNALIAKSFLFKFVNSYNSMFYIAFFKRDDKRFDGCINDDCLGELQKQLATIFLTMLIVNNSMEFFKPKLMILLNRKKQSAEAISYRQLFSKDMSQADIGKSPPELQYELLPYEGTFGDFEEIVLQFGYLTLFVVAFPIAPLLAIVNNLVENRVDASALLVLSRRPLPRGAQNIGTWQGVLNIVATIAIVTNIAIIIFTSEVFRHLTPTQRFTIFLFVEHIMLLLKFSVTHFIDDISEKTKMQLEREQYITDLLINGKNDQEEDY